MVGNCWTAEYETLPENAPPGGGALLDLTHQKQTPQDSPSTPDQPQSNAIDSQFRHAGWAGVRRRVAAALPLSGASESAIASFSECGLTAWVLADATDPSRLRIAASLCHNRWCVPCARRRAAVIAANLRRQLTGQVIRLVTLTLRASPDPLPVQLTRLYRCFSALRRRPVWRDAVTGGAAFLEVTWSAEKRRWHPHLHVLCEGNYIEKSSLVVAWQSVTGDSYIVDVSLLTGGDAIASYITKYVTKPVPAAVYRDDAALTEAMTAFRGRHVALTFGSWRGFRLTEEPDDATDWLPVCSLAALLCRVAANDDAAEEIIAALRRNGYGAALDAFWAAEPNSS